MHYGKHTCVDVNILQFEKNIRHIQYISGSELFLLNRLACMIALERALGLSLLSLYWPKGPTTTHCENFLFQDILGESCQNDQVAF